MARWQIIEAGGTDEWIRWARGQGRLVWVRRGVYAVAGVPTEDVALMAACLACGPTGAASHLAAVGGWGFDQVKKDLLQVTSFDGVLHRLPGVTTHVSRLDPENAVTKCGGLPLVVAPLAVVQVARKGDRYFVARIVNDMIKRKVTTFAEILEWIGKANDGPRPDLRRLCLDALAVGGHYDSPACRDLCLRLTKAGVTDYETDYQFTDAEGVLLVDIAWPPDTVGIEYNGARDHDTPLARAEDARRRNRLAAAGWTMLEANRTMSLDDIVRWALRALRAARPTA